jgi:DNA polymerase-3 subunit gamma/tau
VISSLTVIQAERSVELFLNLHRDIRYSLNPRYELELVLSKLSYIQEYLSSGEILKRIEELRGELIQGTSADNAGDAIMDPGRKDKVTSENTFQEKQSTEFSGTGAAGTGTTGTDSTVADLEEQKNQVIAALRNKKLILSTALEKATKWELLSDRLEITFNSAFLVSSVDADLTSVAEAFEKVTGIRTRIVLKVEGRSKDQESNSSDRQVEMVKRVFRGEIVQGDNR